MVSTDLGKESLQDNIVGSVPVYLNIENLPPDVSHDMIAYYHDKLDNLHDKIHFNNMHRLAFYKTIEHSLFALFLYEVHSDKFLVNEGFYSDHVSGLLKNYLHHLLENGKSKTFEVYVEENLYEFEIRLTIYDSRKYVYGVISSDLQRQIEDINYIERLFYRFYLRKNELVRDHGVFDCIPDINKRLDKFIQAERDKSESIYLVLLEIEPLKKYIRVAGDYLVNQIIRNVKMEINTLVGGSDECFILNSRQYLICIKGLSETEIKEKFKHAHFRIKNLLLVYRMKYFEIRNFESDFNLYDVWSEIMIK